jgi:hypothetical protein
MFFISSKSDFFSQVVLFRSRRYLSYLHQELNEQPKLILSKEQEHVARIYTRLKFKENSNPVCLLGFITYQQNTIHKSCLNYMEARNKMSLIFEIKRKMLIMLLE